MNLDLAGLLNQARRQAMLTGKPFTDQETQGLTGGWRNAQMGLANEQRQNMLAQDQLAQNRWATQAQMDAAQKGQTNQLIGNVVNTGGSMLGMDWMKAKPGQSLIKQGYDKATDLFNNGADKVSNLFGGGTPPPDVGNIAPAASVAPSAPGVGAMPAVSPELGSLAPSAVSPTIAGLSGVGSNIAGDASLMGGEQTAQSLIPLSETGTLGANAAMDAGIGATGWGAIAGASDMADRMLVRPLLKDSNDTTKVIEDVFNPLGAVHDLCGTWICTATAKHSRMKKKEEAVMKKLRSYARENHPGWWNSYFKNGTHLVGEIVQQETDLPKFYDNIRKILVEPVMQTFEEDAEAAFQIYLFVTQTLFKAYMPEFVFKEIE